MAAEAAASTRDEDELTARRLCKKRSHAFLLVEAAIESPKHR